METTTRKFDPKCAIVLVSAKQGAGRETISKGLRDLMGREGTVCSEFRFAEPLHRMMAGCLEVANSIGIETPKKDGPLLQILGHEWLRTYYGFSALARHCRQQVDHWCETDGHGMFPALSVITDARYPDEFDAFPDAIRVRLECDRDKRRERARHWRQTEQHGSEVGLDAYYAMGKFDLVIDTGYHDAETSAAILYRYVRDCVAAGQIIGRGGVNERKA